MLDDSDLTIMEISKPDGSVGILWGERPNTRMRARQAEVGGRFRHFLPNHLRNDWFIPLRSSPRRQSARRSESHLLKTHRTVHPLLPRVLLEYTLTRICSVEYIRGMESVFEIIAEPNRRAILSLLVSSQQSVGEIERQLRMPQPTVSKHLRVLRDAGFVESTVDAQRRLYRLKPEPLQEVDMWLAQFRRCWSAHVDALERHLDHLEQATVERAIPSKSKTRRRRRGPKPRA